MPERKRTDGPVRPTLDEVEWRVSVRDVARAPRSVGRDRGPARIGFAPVPGAYSRLVRPLLFRLDPERAHELAIAGLGLAAPVLGPRRRRPTAAGG